MTIGLVFLTVLMGVIVWWLLRQTINVQPWQAQAALPAAVGAAAPRPAIKAALWVFLGVATSLFVLFVSAYAMRLGFEDWTPLPRPRLLVLNTALLAAASLAMEWTVHAGRRSDREGVARGLVASGVLTAGFLMGQLVVWGQLHSAGYFMATSAATAFFYLFTAAHGLHVLGGLVAWARAVLRVRRGPDPAGIRLAVELCATYWHYLLAVWVVLYALLVSDGIGLAICSSTPL
ncbi:MAG: cytochrome c oxidase subunit family protein [Ramlibacter sp.]|jgi:cytochrome c oxidase subunit 3|uniref:cytochrome c oxidase subunit 3 n=1 Tax=Ramlibacter sp. TaxID=1917967 RepID=UPI002613AAAC|nr:cytochrome c oxidase subunit 3 [Ramlibacter sp.]MDB5752356.1 cytochrome c oxidase subunit family protein [Ramlibacter sp.]